jgi:hypothetical protein
VLAFGGEALKAAIDEFGGCVDMMKPTTNKGG